MFSKSSFGALNTSFGVSSNANPNSSFVQPSTSFGQPPKSLFGVPALGSNFGQQAQNQSIFGSSFFGSSQGSGNNSFGNANNSIFPQLNKSTALNQMETASSQTSGIFASNTPNDQLGTPMKFSPVSGTETIPKAGINHTLNIRYQAITCMKEYEIKSFEELRLEDYQLNRKGAQLGLFGSTNKSNGISFFNNTPAVTSANSLFGQKDNKAIFGQTATSTGFGQTNSIFGITPTNSTSTGLFNNTGYGANVAASSTSPFNSTTQANTIFGSNTGTNNPFLTTAPANTSFGQTSGYGTQATFGANQAATNQNTSFFNQNTNLFNQNKTMPLLNFTPASASNSVGIFGQSIAPNTNFNFSGPTTTTSSTVASNFSQSPFGQLHQGKYFNSSANKSVTPLFGQRQKSNSVGGTGNPIGGGMSFFGNNASKPTMFNSNVGQMNNFGSPTSSSFNTIQDTAAQMVSMQNKGQEQIIAMASTPYGSTNILNNISTSDTDIKDYTRPTNPAELNAILKGIKKIKTSRMTEKLKPTQVFGRKVPVFGLEYYDESLVLNDRVNYNPKRLIIRNNSSNIKNSLDDNYIETTSSAVLVTNNENLEDEDIYSDLRALRKKVSNNKQYITKSSETNNNSIFSSGQPIFLTDVSKTLNLQTNNNKNNTGSEATDKIQLTETNEPDELNPENADDLDNISSSTESYETSLDEPVIQHPAGVILTRPEYYTVPSLNELVNYLDADGSCLVQGFTVGRYSYGSVYFPDTFDVSNLNIDELVHFRHKEINIYPDESKKPPRGQGLNRRGQVTLDKVFPRDKETKSLITDVETLIKMDYSGKLRKLCDKQDTRFVDYRPDTGSWVFKVNHF